MALQPRGMKDGERFAVSTVHASASVTMITTPCYLWGYTVSHQDNSASGQCVLTDGTASADTDTDTSKVCDLILPDGGASAGTLPLNVEFNKPIFISKTLTVKITNADVCVRFSV